MKRRDKRRHNAQTSASSSLPSGFRDPRFVLQLAVRMDEELGEEYLKEPLRFYGDIDAFKRAVSILTKGEGRNNKQQQSDGPTTPAAALTPIILSGLLAAQQARQEEEQNDENITQHWPNASELVSYCTTIRKQALIRIQKRRNRRKLRLFAIVALVGFLCGAAYYHTIGSMERSMIELSYTIVSSNNEDADNEFVASNSGLVPCAFMTTQGDKEACRAAEAQLWAYFRDYASIHSSKLRDCTRRKCSRDSRNIIRRQLCSISGRTSDVEYAQGPYAMHTVAVREANVLKTAFSKASFEPWWIPSEEHDGKFKRGLQWIGETTINQLVRKRLLEAIQNLKKKGSFRLLDVGCGIGGTLYALSGASEDRWTEQENEHARVLEYLGIAISSAEVQNARRLATEHEMDLTRARFEQASFDSPSLGDYGKFSAAVAIESLSFSQNLTDTLSNLASVMRSGGTLIVVDDVVNSQHGECYNNTDGDSVVETYALLASRPSLLSHKEWKDAFENAGFELTQAMDIGLEFDLPQLIDKRGRTSSRGWLFGPRRRGVFITLLQKWQAWKQSRLGDSTDIQKLAELQTLELMQQNINFIRSKSYRKEAHERLQLTYNMYVCTKR